MFRKAAILSFAAAAVLVAFAAREAAKKGPAMITESYTEYGKEHLNTDEPNTLEGYSQATFGAGCFWGTEHVFRQIPGIVYTEVGYMGGRLKNPTYERVCRGDTNHAEVVHLYYDPNVIPYGRLLDTFFEIHNPTSLNRQGNDRGSQYRSIVFTYTDEQQKEALARKQELDKSDRYNRPIVTEVVPAMDFWRAEEYHQRYLEKNPGGYCHIPPGVIRDVVEKNR
jgi:peptide-methionine (S)-S-oxide reductase